MPVSCTCQGRTYLMPTKLKLLRYGASRSHGESSKQLQCVRVDGNGLKIEPPEPTFDFQTNEDIVFCLVAHNKNQEFCQFCAWTSMMDPSNIGARWLQFSCKDPEGTFQYMWNKAYKHPRKINAKDLCIQMRLFLVKNEGSTQNAIILHFRDNGVPNEGNIRRHLESQVKLGNIRMEKGFDIRYGKISKVMCKRYYIVIDEKSHQEIAESWSETLHHVLTATEFRIRPSIPKPTHPFFSSKVLNPVTPIGQYKQADLKFECVMNSVEKKKILRKEMLHDLEGFVVRGKRIIRFKVIEREKSKKKWVKIRERSKGSLGGLEYMSLLEFSTSR